MVEDKKLHKLLWSLDGITVGMPEVLPVRTQHTDGLEPPDVKSTDKKGKRREWAATKLTPHLNRVVAVLKEHPYAEMSTKDIKSSLDKAGLSTKSLPYVMVSLQKLGRLDRVGYGRYVLTPESESI